MDVALNAKESDRTGAPATDSKWTSRSMQKKVIERERQRPISMDVALNAERERQRPISMDVALNAKESDRTGATATEFNSH
jgi:hypothetical protein